MISFFYYNDARSTDYNLLMNPEFDLNGPESDIEFREIPGVDGDVAIFNNRLKGVTRSIPVYIRPHSKVSVEEIASKISNWLTVNAGWKDLVFSNSPEFVYKAIYIEEFQLQKTITQYSKAILTFRLKPYKFYKSGLEEIKLENGISIYNPGSRPSRPRLKVIGNGNITIFLNGEPIKLEAVESGVIIDVLDDVITDMDNRYSWDKLLSYPFPRLEPGEVEISWTGADSVSIVPRWEEVLP